MSFPRVMAKDVHKRDLQYFKDAGRILDAGCGRGMFLKMLEKRGVGIDGSRDNVAYCRSIGLDVHEVLLPGILPFGDNEFDGIYCSHLIEHFAPNDAIDILTGLDRVLRPGGVLLIRSPLYSPSFFDDPTHVRPYHLHCILNLLGGWKEDGNRQMIVGNTHPSYTLKYYYEEIIPFYTPNIAPTIAPKRFPFRLLLRGLSHFMTGFHIGRKGKYGGILIKNK